MKSLYAHNKKMVCIYCKNDPRMSMTLVSPICRLPQIEKQIYKKLCIIFMLDID